jgi:fermentation-respiration switch protein FrsA (DUF1100 family)
MKSIERNTLVLLLALTLTGCSGLFFYPSRQMVDNPVLAMFTPEDVSFRSEDGVGLHGWLFRAKEPKGSILVLHGNAENISTHVGSVLWLVPAGYNLFIFDYRGYGRSEGRPTIRGVHLDAQAALDKLLSLPGIDSGRIVVLGQSIGGSIAVYLVAHTPHKDRIRALVIDSAFSSYRRIAREKMDDFWITWPFQYPFSLFFNDDYSAVKFIGQVAPVPLLILHGEQDPIVPVHHGWLLYEAASEPKELRITAQPGHIRAFADEAGRRDLLRFLDRAL